MSGLSINGTNVTPNNVSSFGLYKRFESKIADIYSRSPKSKKGQFIIHIKRPDLYSKNNTYLTDKNYHKSQPEVDWTEEGLEENIGYLNERL